MPQLSKNRAAASCVREGLQILQGLSQAISCNSTQNRLSPWHVPSECNILHVAITVHVASIHALK